MTNHPNRNRSKQQQSTHTPGPWELGEIKGKGMTRSVMIKPLIGVLDGFSYTNAHFEANARLSAAAPELLAALNGLLNCFNSNGEIEETAQDQLSVALEKAELAQAKAEGR